MSNRNATIGEMNHSYKLMQDLTRSIVDHQRSSELLPEAKQNTQKFATTVGNQMSRSLFCFPRSALHRFQTSTEVLVEQKLGFPSKDGRIMFVASSRLSRNT